MKKKGEFLDAKHRHQRQQALYDAIKKCRLEGTSFVTFRGERMKLSHDLDDPKTFQSGYCQWALVKSGGRVRLAWLNWKDGCQASLVGMGDVWVTGGEESFQIASKDILCAVSPASDSVLA